MDNRGFSTIRSYFLSLLIAISFCTTCNATSKSTIDITHFRAFPIYLEDGKGMSYVRHTAFDPSGSLWISGGKGLMKYNGYQIDILDLPSSQYVSEPVLSYLFYDANGQLWIGNNALHFFDKKQQTLLMYDITEGQNINDMEQDKDGMLWLAGDFGLMQFDPLTKKKKDIVWVYEGQNFHPALKNLSYDAKNDALFFFTGEALFRLKRRTLSLTRIDIPFDLTGQIIRDMSIDLLRNRLWVGSSEGLVNVDLDSLSTTVVVADQKSNQLLGDHINTTFVDSLGNLWLGVEKSGLCMLPNSIESANDGLLFSCLKGAINEKYKLPLTSIEDISEDSEGTLWISLNNYGLMRITPKREKFRPLKDFFSNEPKRYFPHSYDGIVRTNGEIWIATDGGGINIYNANTGRFETMQHNPSDANSLPSNSVLSLTVDDTGAMWASMWSGGFAKINPETRDVTSFLRDPKKPDNLTLMGNNAFAVLPDNAGGVWLSIWGYGLQRYDIETDNYVNYPADTKSKGETTQSANINHLTYFDNKLWLIGERGFEVFDPKTQQFEFLFNDGINGSGHIFIRNEDEMYIGSRNGLVKFNYLTKQKALFTKEDGLPSNEVHYSYIDKYGTLWVACDIGIAWYNREENRFVTYTERDGIVGSHISTHGEFFENDSYLFVTGKEGVTVINPLDIPPPLNMPKTYITSVAFSSPKEGVRTVPKYLLNKKQAYVLDYRYNNLRFEFTSSNLIFPERNRYKYWLKGYHNNFTYTTANERFASFTNLPPGEYIFEAFSSIDGHKWGNQYDSFQFTILTPWWQTGWFRVLMFILFSAILYCAYYWKTSLALARQKELEQKVNEKTNALKIASHSLQELNTNLEQRVQHRTAELETEIKERKSVEAKLYHMAFHDALTDLSNRQWLINKLETLIQTCNTEESKPFGILLLDGDRFKHINDTHGHLIGDALLIAVAQRIGNLLTSEQHICRLGGDEFTVLVENVDDAKQLEALAEIIISRFKHPFVLERSTIYFNVSIGILLCNHHYNSVPSILRDADIAMYRAKELGKANFKLFDEEIRDTKIELARLEADLHTAISEDAFHLVYQPIVNLQDETLSGFEALIRWKHPIHGFIPPDVFIPIAEESGMISDIGNWVLDEACKQTQHCAIKPRISVNISSYQLQHTHFLDVIDNALQRSGLKPEYLLLELTESTLIENTDNINWLLGEIDKRHIDLAIDDFGKGYSSLTYLSVLPVDNIKIDKKFIAAMDDNRQGAINQKDLRILDAIVSLVRSLSKHVTAEGIETDQQYQALKRMGSQYGQGYFISRPLTAKDARKYLLSYRPPSKTDKKADQ
jgi:diguanylate cyclase (GGDEF)-like protein